MSFKDFCVVLVLTAVGFWLAFLAKPAIDVVINKVVDQQYNCYMVGATQDDKPLAGSKVVFESELQKLKLTSSTFLGIRVYHFVEFNGEYATNAIPVNDVKTAAVVCKKI
jgi:hypothetical protein